MALSECFHENYAFNRSADHPDHEKPKADENQQVAKYLGEAVLKGMAFSTPNGNDNISAAAGYNYQFG
jgi:hypothetical protein